MSYFVELSDQGYEFDDDGYLVRMSDWDSQIRDRLAEEQKIELTDDHLQVIDYLRAYFAKHHDHPSLRIMTTELSKILGQQKGNAKFFHKLFPAGPRQADKIAGLPKRLCCC